MAPGSGSRPARLAQVHRPGSVRSVPALTNDPTQVSGSPCHPWPESCSPQSRPWPLAFTKQCHTQEYLGCWELPSSPPWPGQRATCGLLLRPRVHMWASGVPPGKAGLAGWGCSESPFLGLAYLQGPQEVPEITADPGFRVHLGCAARGQGEKG